ncbi:MAG: hypothetical protein HYR49_11100 [Gammaproteobacteria bacterium]|nr:hypothetical protein [Gammaproteobacteria bacterium]
MDSPRWLALICGGGQILAINLAYVLAAHAGHVPWCLPYWDGCTSISATGRHLPEAVLFKAAMLPLALCVIFYWRAMGRFLVSAGATAGATGRRMQWTGISAALLLTGYLLMLGIDGATARGLRHALVVLSFALTFIAQALVTAAVRRCATAGRAISPEWMPGALLLLSGVTLLLGLGNVLLEALDLHTGRAEDAIEWNLAVLLDLHFALTWFLRRKMQS